MLQNLNTKSIFIYFFHVFHGIVTRSNFSILIKLINILWEISMVADSK